MAWEGAGMTLVVVGMTGVGAGMTGMGAGMTAGGFTVWGQSIANKSNGIKGRVSVYSVWSIW